MRNVMEFHEMDVTERVTTRWLVQKVFRDNYINLAIVHISAIHTTPQKFTPEAGHATKVATKNDM